MSNHVKKLDVCIVGGGFAGLNSALLLAKEGINCEMYTTGYGASNLWMGTLDFLTYNSADIETSFNSFCKAFPQHPYVHFSYKEARKALLQFFADFPDVKCFTIQGKFTNELVLSSLGTLKPCLGIWGSLFHEFDALHNDTNVILIGFREFNNSSLYLLKKGLEERFPSSFAILNLSFKELYSRMEEEVPQASSPSNLSEFKLGRFFDTFFDKMALFTDMILSNLKDQLPKFSGKKIDIFLFPPILGVNRNPEILRALSINLNSKCRELIALSPSLIANRLLNEYEKKLKQEAIQINKGWSLIELENQKKYDQVGWKLIFEDKKGNRESLLSKSIIFSTGSMFQAGILETERKMRDYFAKIDIPIPNKLDSSFQLIFNGGKDTTNLYLCGSAIYTFTDQTSDEMEIIYGTGLGIPIITSYKIAQSLLNKPNTEK